MAEPVSHFQQGRDGHRDAGQTPTQRDLPHLDPPADLDLLAGGQERDLPDLLQIQSDRVFALRGKGRQHFVRNRRRALFGFFLDERYGRGLLGFLGEHGRRHGVRGPQARFAICLSECHDVTRLGTSIF